MNRPSTKSDVWILGDSLSIQFMLRKALEGSYSLRFFRTLGEMNEAVKRCSAPNALVADLRLDDGTFLDFLASHENYVRSVPTIVVSGVDDIEVLRRCFSAGVRDYIHKPFGRNELVIKIENLLSGNADRIESEPILDSELRTVAFGNRETPRLTPKEYRILTLLPYKKYVTRDHLVLCALKDAQVKETSLDVHLVSLRRKLRTVGLSVQHDSARGYFLTELP